MTTLTQNCFQENLLSKEDILGSSLPRYETRILFASYETEKENNTGYPYPVSTFDINVWSDHKPTLAETANVVALYAGEGYKAIRIFTVDAYDLIDEI